MPSDVGLNDAGRREASLTDIVAKALEKLADNGSKRFTAEQLATMRAAFDKTGGLFGDRFLFQKNKLLIDN